MSGPGRNDPCACGSGRKYKRCCGSKASATTEITLAQRESVIDKLLSFASRDEFHGAHKIAETLFWSTNADGFSNERIKEIASSTMVEINYQSFVLFSLSIDEDKTIVDLFLKRRARALSSAERTYLKSLAASYVGLYEVIEVRPGAGLRLRNLWFEEEERWIDERIASQTLNCWDVLAARLLQEPSGKWVLEGELYPYPTHFKQQVLDQLEEDQRAAESAGRSISPVALLKRCSFRFHGLWLETLRPKPQKLATFDGNPLVLSVHHYTIKSPTQLVRALDACEELQDEQQERWVYLRERDGVHHLVGELRIKRSKLLVSAMCDAHGRDVRALIERIAGEAVRFLRTEEGDIDKLMEQGATKSAKGRADAGGTEGPAPAADTELIKRALDQHYRRWLDEKIPALGGSTPRAAAADDRLRQRLVELLKTMENQEQHRPSMPGAEYDFGWLRRELGLGPGPSSARPSTPQLVADLGHYLDGEGLSSNLPAEARRLALYLGSIAGAASRGSHMDAVGPISTGINCRRRPFKIPCAGTLRVLREEQSDILSWSCPSCGDGGTIAGWRGTAFDLSNRPPNDEFKQSDGESREIQLRSSDLRRLLRLPHLTRPALALLVAATRDDEEALLAGSTAEFEALASCVALKIAVEDDSASGWDRLVELHRGFSWAAGRESDLTYPALAAELLISKASRLPRPTPLPTNESPEGGHTIRVRLLEIEPPIWRRLELPSRMTLADLHSVLILTMGWANYHLHVFELGKRSFGPPHPEDPIEVEDSRNVLLGELLPQVGDSLVYEYDFGDCWRHELQVESISASPPARARLIDGARACPPEDCGGTFGHERLLAALSDPFHPEHEELRTWAGDDFDPERFHQTEREYLLERLASAWRRAPGATPRKK